MHLNRIRRFIAVIQFGQGPSQHQHGAVTALRQPPRRIVMAWFTENWFWVLTFIAFVAMHMFGHGGHGGHGGGDHQRSTDGKENDRAQSHAVQTKSGSHQH